MEWTPRPLVEHLREQERHNVTVITVGSKYEVYVRSSAPSHMQTVEQPFRTLAIKWEVNIFLKKSSCVVSSCILILHASFIPALSCVVYSCVCLWCCVVVMLNDDVDDYITPLVVCFVSRRYNQSLFVLFYVIFESSYRCIDVNFNDGVYFSSLKSQTKESTNKIM